MCHLIGTSVVLRLPRSGDITLIAVLHDSAEQDLGELVFFTLRIIHKKLIVHGQAQINFCTFFNFCHLLRECLVIPREGIQSIRI